MDFSSLDIRDLLKASMPVRFADISPYDFEDFIAELFRADGYTVDETPYSGDFGADLVLQKDGVKTVVQVKRYGEQTSVGVSDVNQVIGARTYYDAEEALVITTSGFTQSAIQLAKSGAVFLWDWERLETFLSEVFLDGQDYYTYFQDDLVDNVADPNEFRLHFHRLDLEEQFGERDAVLTYMGLENLSGKNVYLHLELPLVVNKVNRQVAAVAWKESYFHDGLLVAGATVESGCFFLKDQLGEVKPGDRIIVRMHIRGRKDPVIIDQKIGLPKSGCYVVTCCFGRDSLEYGEMIRVRNEMLRTQVGVSLVRWYYRMSPALVHFIRSSKPGASVLEAIVGVCIRCLLRLARLTGKLTTQMQRMSAGRPNVF